MKKIDLYIATLLVVVFSCMSCGGPSERTADGKLNPEALNFNAPESYIKAVKDNDYKLAHDILEHLYGRYLAHHNDYKAKEWRDRYWTAAMHIYKDEMQWLLPQNDQEANRRFIYTLQSMNPIGEKPQPNQEYAGGSDSSGPDAWSPQLNYMIYVNEVNKIYLEAVKISLIYDNLDVAQTVYKFMRPGISWECSFDAKNTMKDYKFIYNENNDVKNEAKQLIDEYLKNNK